ncbi:hypothetical protein JW897_06385 [Chromobacterium alkanivorans]|uniref:Uncharacterized protein n=1 Tax=Chromobacterium haemolyticum TaxID=394935 RepID=A0A1W0CCZ8_9NEIS|nr:MULTISPECIES: hypothetical protein [Chromobacterium]MBN3003363.1 hypothetical protein [Chromobacterium alkanivorans]MDH0340628.1 hypothetical protein [Chromobacterium haemolyticum]OQS32585.1 hypothetical protein B0T45_21525 [Chromobacterium haemolyticum]
MSTWKYADLQAVEAAIASGELEIYRDGAKVTYRSVAELERAREVIRNHLRASGQLAAEPAALPSVTYAAFSRD